MLCVIATKTSIQALEPIPKCPDSLKNAKYDLTHVLEFLSNDTSDVLLLSIASGSQIKQIIPKYIINTAKNYPDISFCVIAIDEWHTQENLKHYFVDQPASSPYNPTKSPEQNISPSLKKLFPNTSPWTIENKITHTQIIPPKELCPHNNVSIYAFSRLIPYFPLSESEKEQYQIGVFNWLKTFFKKKLTDGKIILVGTHYKPAFNFDLFWSLFVTVAKLKQEFPLQITYYTQEGSLPWNIYDPPSAALEKQHSLLWVQDFSSYLLGFMVDQCAVFEEINDMTLFKDRLNRRLIIQSINGELINEEAFETKYAKNYGKKRCFGRLPPDFKWHSLGSCPDVNTCPIHHYITADNIIISNALFVLKEKLLALAQALAR
jgi:hypothetical protein